MKFLSSPKKIEATLDRLIRKSLRLRWAVAWASQSSPLFKCLTENQQKIGQLTVGIHFYQTDPKFIESFMDHKRTSFVMNPDGVFHPKLYFFEFEDNKWECVVGSANFTHGGLTTNCEVAVHFSHSDLGAAAFLSEIKETLDSFKSMGKRLTPLELSAYRAVWRRQQDRLRPLSGRYQGSSIDGRSGKSPLDVELFVEDWRAYYKSVAGDKTQTEARLAVLEEAKRLFAAHRRFRDMDESSRKGIAGFLQTEELDWLWFGSMKGHGYFKQAVIQNNETLSDALDEIPMNGAVTNAHFDRFVEKFREAFPNAGVATATRLLALKRPDYFVCFDSKNRKKLCEAFETPQNVTLDDYWERVVGRLTDSNWWNSSPPSELPQRRIWNCRAAFLDVLFYEA